MSQGAVNHFDTFTLCVDISNIKFYYCFFWRNLSLLQPSAAASKHHYASCNWFNLLMVKKHFRHGPITYQTAHHSPSKFILIFSIWVGGMNLLRLVKYPEALTELAPTPIRDYGD